MSNQGNFLTTTRHNQGYKKIIFGKEQHTVSIMTLSPIKEVIWKRVFGLYKLACIIVNITDSHLIPDITTAVANEILIVTEYIMEEADKVSTLLFKKNDAMYQIYTEQGFSLSKAHTRKGWNQTT